MVHSQTLAGLTLDQLGRQYRHDLFEEFLPLMDRYVVDHEFGGFAHNIGPDGANPSGTKDAWFQGRGIWVYSFLFNNFGQDQRYLSVAEKAVEFVMKLEPTDQDTLWPRVCTREGTPLKAAAEIYGDLFIAEGLAEYGRAAGERKYWNLAKQIISKSLRIYDQPDYHPDVVAMYRGPKTLRFPGARAQGVSMVLIRVINQMLETHPDDELERLISHCVDVVLKRHYNPAFRLNVELLAHDFSWPSNELSQFVSTGHSIETLWMIMQEAVRQKDGRLFELAAERFRRHVEVAWDDVYGGVFRNLVHVDENLWSLDKALWVQEEVLVGSLLLLELTGEDWAKQVFSRTYHYLHEQYPLRTRAYPPWIPVTDRKLHPDPRATWVENYHHPRQLMLNLLRIDRMVRDGGVQSCLFPRSEG